jgi:HNH endonuclease
MRKIRLTKGKFALVDDADYKSLSKFKWHIDQHEATCYAHRTPWVHGKNRSRTIRMHRQIMGFPKGLVDHRNGNGLDNRRRNLRLATKSQNSANSRRLSSRNTSGFRGVCLARDGKWQAQIKVNGKFKYLGRFKTARQAHNAFQKYAHEIYGDFMPQ